jgi:hypothetical protein
MDGSPTPADTPDLASFSFCHIPIEYGVPHDEARKFFPNTANLISLEEKQ